MKSYMCLLISSGLSWFKKWATPSITTSSCKYGTSLLKPPPCIYSLTPGVLYVMSRSPTMNLTGTLICTPVHGAVSSQVLQTKQNSPNYASTSFNQINKQNLITVSSFCKWKLWFWNLIDRDIHQYRSGSSSTILSKVTYGSHSTIWLFYFHGKSAIEY